MRSSWSVVIALSLVCALPARADDDVDAYRRAVEARALAAGVPAAPLLAKVREGVAKGVPLGRIRPVVERLHENLVRASALCAGWAGRDACALAAGDALEAGVTPEAVAELFAGPAARLDEPTRLRALYAIGDLQGRGVEPAAAVRLVALVAEQEAARLPGLADEVARRAAASQRGIGAEAADWARGGAPPGPPSAGGAERGRGAGPPGRDVARDREGRLEADPATKSNGRGRGQGNNGNGQGNNGNGNNGNGQGNNGNGQGNNGNGQGNNGNGQGNGNNGNGQGNNGNGNGNNGNGNNGNGNGNDRD